MKRFEELFEELQAKTKANDAQSRTVRAISEGPHHIGKKIIEEAAEVLMAAQYEGKEKTAEEISQLLYHVQVMMLACGLTLEDVYEWL